MLKDHNFGTSGHKMIGDRCADDARPYDQNPHVRSASVRCAPEMQSDVATASSLRQLMVVGRRSACGRSLLVFIELVAALEGIVSGGQGTLFDERFLGRYAGAIMSDPTTALVELVANAWDAYATKVEVQWPDRETGTASRIVDNGLGMTAMSSRSAGAR